MAPLPKRKHSTQRKGKRLKKRKILLTNLVKCSHCGKPKRSHRLCQYCYQ